MPRVPYRRSIAFQLHLAAGLILLGVLGLIGVSTHFAQRTREATTTLIIDGLRASGVAARLELLLQQHRGIVEGAAVDLTHEHAAAPQHSLDTINAQLVALGSLLQGADVKSVRDLGGQLGRELPVLFAKADGVLRISNDASQDQARQTARVPYASAASLMQQQITRWRQKRDAILHQESKELSASADRLISRVLACSVCLLVFAVLATIVGQRQLHRLARLKRSVIRLANRDTAVPIPSLGSRDEIGAVARAMQGFKETAVRAAAQEIKLAESAQQLETALRNMSQGLCLYDAENRLQIFNCRFSNIFGIDHDKVRRGMTYREVLQLSLEAGNIDANELEARIKRLRAGQAQAEPQTDMQKLAGDRYVMISYRYMGHNGWVVTYEDISSRHAAEQKINHMARHDALTDLPNRIVLNEWLEHAVAQTGRGIQSALLCLDLDRFKVVNDTLGHPVGDALLCAVSDRLLALVRDADMVARLGGDEFAIVQHGIQRPEDAKLLSERIVQTISAPFDLDGHQVTVGVSIGIALTPADGTHADKLLRNADLALYRAKSDGRGRSCFFEPEMDSRLQHRRTLELDLRAALALGQFELFYQPLVNLQRGEVSGFEALLRWRHPERGLVPPGEFIPLIEDIGLIIPVGEWVIGQACRDAAGWPSDIKVAVNLSPVQFKDSHLARIVTQALVAAGLPARRLEVEITESVLLQENETTLSTLHEFRELGVKIAMDDFGTGYSSLSYLRSFPFDKVKIDQSFIRDLSRRKDSVHVVRAVTGLCESLGMATTAEGVETVDQLATLRTEGCTEVQGFLFSRPQPVAHVPGIIIAVREMNHDAREPLLASL